MIYFSIAIKILGKGDKYMKYVKERSKYGVFSNIIFMLKQAREAAPSVVWLVILMAILTVCLQTIQLLFTPAILQTIEVQKSLQDLLLLILRFTIILLIINALRAYVRENTMYGRVGIRTNIIANVSKKQGITSYPNIFNSEFQKLLDRALSALSSNSSPGEAIWETFSAILEGFLGSAVYLFFMSRIEPWIILLTIGTTITSFLLSKRINEWGYRHRDEVASISKELNYIIGRSSNNIDAKDIRMFNMKPWLDEVYEKAFRLYRNFHFKSQRIYFGADLIDLILSLLRNGIAYIYLINITIESNLSIANFVLLFTAINGLTQKISSLLKDITKLHRESLEISTIRECIGFNEPFKFEEGLPIEPNPNGEYKIELKDVSFRYPGSEEDTLNSINLTIQPREKLAIVGLNGAGKTTLVKLITGLYDPTEGEVLLNEKSIKDFNRFDIYRHFSAVFQQFSVIAGSVYENVGQTREENMDLNLANSVIDQAGLLEKVSRLPKSGHTKLVKDVYEDATQLSGGELQRLMLARALYKNAPILILDEPTAALDPIAENKIYLHYNEMTEKRTSLFISHRLASTRFCDRIVFIGDGKILEEGTHDELMVKDGAYANLFDVQSRYYKDEDGGMAYEG